MQRRARRRTEKVDYARLNGDVSDGEEERRPDYRRHLHLLLNSSKFNKDGHQILASSDLSMEWLAGGNFTLPTLVPKASGSLEQLELRLPSTGLSKQISMEHFINEIGLDAEVHTIDVASQKAGPRWILHQWGQYWTVRRSISAKSKKSKAPKLKKGKNVGSIDDEAESSRSKIGTAPPDARETETPTVGEGFISSSNVARSIGTGVLKKGISNDSRRRILELVALPLAGTSLGSAISQPRLVRESELTQKVCPSSWEGHRDIGTDSGLVANIAPTGAYSDFKFAPGGSAIWLHVMTGKKVLCCAPPTQENLAAYLAWTRHPMRSQIFFGAVAEGIVQLEVHAGDTLLIPSGWMMAQGAVDDSIVIGSTFSHAEALGSQLASVALDRALQVPSLPALKQLLWYAAKHIAEGLKECLGDTTINQTLSNMPPRTAVETNDRKSAAHPGPQDEPDVPRKQRSSTLGMKRRAILLDDEDDEDEEAAGPPCPHAPASPVPMNAEKGVGAVDADPTQSAGVKPVKLKVSTPPPSPLPSRKRRAREGATSADLVGKGNAPAIAESRPAGIRLKVAGKLAVTMAVPSLPKEHNAPLPPLPQAAHKRKVKVKLPAAQEPASEFASQPLPSLKFKLNPAAASVTRPNEAQPPTSPAHSGQTASHAKSASGELSELLAASKTRIRLRPPGPPVPKDSEAEATIPQVDGADDEVMESGAAYVHDGGAAEGRRVDGNTAVKFRRSDGSGRGADCLSGSGMRAPGQPSPSGQARGSAGFITPNHGRPQGLQVETSGISLAEDCALSATSRAGSLILGLPRVEPVDTFMAPSHADEATDDLAPRIPSADMRRPGEDSNAVRSSGMEPDPGPSDTHPAAAKTKQAPAGPTDTSAGHLQEEQEVEAAVKMPRQAESPDTVTGSIQMSHPQPSTGECPGWAPPRADTAESSGHPHDDLDDQLVDQPLHTARAPDLPGSNSGKDIRALKPLGSLKREQSTPSGSQQPMQVNVTRQGPVTGPTTTGEPGPAASLSAVNFRRGGSNTGRYYPTAPEGEVLIPLGRSRHLSKSNSLSRSAGLAARAGFGSFAMPAVSPTAGGLSRQGSRAIGPMSAKEKEVQRDTHASDLPNGPKPTKPVESRDDQKRSPKESISRDPEAGSSGVAVPEQDEAGETSGPAADAHVKEAAALPQPIVKAKPVSTYKVGVRKLEGEWLGSWRAADAVALLCTLETWLAESQASVPQDIADPETVLKTLEAGLWAVGVDVNEMMAKSPMRWRLEDAALSNHETVFDQAIIQEALPPWPIYDDAEAMEQAATSTPEAIVGSPGDVDYAFTVEDAAWEEREMRRAKKSKLHPGGGSHLAGANKMAAAHGGAAIRRPAQKQSKMSVHERLRKKLRMK